MSLNPETEHLAGCPWCDRAPKSYEWDGGWLVACEDGLCRADCEVGALTRREAERLWNVRPEETRLRAQRDEEREAVVRYRGRVAALEVEVASLRETLAGMDEAAAMNQAENARLRAAIEAHRRKVNIICDEPPAKADHVLWAELDGGGE